MHKTSLGFQSQKNALSKDLGFLWGGIRCAFSNPAVSVQPEFPVNFTAL